MLPSAAMRRHLIVCVLLVLSSCGGGQAPPPSSTKKPSPPPKPVFCPLTGVETSRDFPITRPALGVKIENSVAARPQVGLDKADIVYEELAEGGITRFLAIFHCSDPESLGPIRSARMVDPDILLEYAPVLFAYSGANPLVLDKVRKTKGVIDLRHGNHGDAYRRERGRRAPHDLFSSSDRLRTLDDAKGVSGSPATGLVFDAAATTTATATAPSSKKTTSSPPSKKAASSPSPSPSPIQVPALSVRFDFSGISNQVRYSYDAGSRSYLRSHGETPHNSGSGKQVAVVNVVILKVKVSEGDIRDAAGNASPEIVVTGAGEATVLRGGLVVTGRWTRRSLAEKTTLVDPSGKPIKLLPGTTWIHLIPEDRKVTLQ